jgi:hypothetical protein
MGSLERRLGRLEEQASLKRCDHPDDEPPWRKENWLARARMNRNRAMDEDTRHARSLIRLFRTQDRLSWMSAEELIERIVSWQPVPDGGRPRPTVEREVSYAIYNQEEGTENMVCPPEWREAFAHGDELRERYAAIPDDVLAEGWVRLREIEDGGGDGEEYAEWRADYEERFGITTELVENAIRLDAEGITEENCRWALNEYAADLLYGEKGYRVQRHIWRLEGNTAATDAKGATR